jgi:hypothetical protein
LIGYIEFYILHTLIDHSRCNVIVDSEAVDYVLQEAAYFLANSLPMIPTPLLFYHQAENVEDQGLGPVHTGNR